MKAIDVHGHFGIYDLGAGPGALANRLHGGEIDVVRSRAKAMDIQLTIVSALRALFPYEGDVQRGNDDAVAAVEGHEDVRFWAVLNPRLKEGYRQVEELLPHPQCAGIKLHPHRHSYDIRTYGEEAVAFAATHHALVLSHTGDPGSFPEDFIPFMDRYPAATLILAHLGHSTDGIPSRQIAAIKQSRAGNVYVDTSSARSMSSNLIDWAVEEVGADRLLFGTDTPLYSVACQKARIESAAISEVEKHPIFHHNAARLLRLPVARGKPEAKSPRKVALHPQTRA